MGAYELRNGVPSRGGLTSASPDVIMAMPPEMLFDYLAVRLNGPKAAKGNTIRLNIDFSDPNSKLLHDPKNKYGLVVENGVLNYGKPLEEKVDATLTLLKATLDSIQLGQITLEDALKSAPPCSRATISRRSKTSWGCSIRSRSGSTS